MDTINENTFKLYMQVAKSHDNDHYINGYRRGLRRHYHSTQFDTEDHHARWMAQTGEQGQGYRDGLAGMPPRGYRPASEDDQPAEVATSVIHINVPRNLKAACVRDAQRQRMKLEQWVADAISEKLMRDSAC